MAIIGITTRTSVHRRAHIHVAVKTAPERYIDPKSVAHSGGNRHGMPESDMLGIK
jgi:hypothetical protein